ncbi:hypothetical protein GEO21_19110 [Sphingobacterium faecium]|uniref:restriction endonuclease subunit S n=1 Tax=Sphingobacterium faecium TaxID=34087 RepID=UPI001290AEBA|nr:restriction endonuclease subunit S [Sphingobacterium faecium]MQP29604.1 hypothetical protein [Sphingobacterium faecium]
MNKVKLKAVCKRITDGAHYSPIGVVNGFPMLSVKDMEENKFNYTNCKYISSEDYNDLVRNDCKPLKNDVLIAKDGSYLKYVFVIKEEIDQAILSSIGILRPNLNIVNPFYLKYYLQTKSVKETVAKKYVSGSALPRIILKNFGEIDLALPDLSTQQKITSILTALDDKIGLNNKINADLEAMAKALYDYWFVQFDFPNKAGKPYKSSSGIMVYNEILNREIPKGWEVKKLDYVVDKIIDYRGKTPKKLDSDWSDNKDDIIAISAKHIKNGKLVNLDNANRVNSYLYEKWMKEKLKEGDILMTSEAPCGEFFYLVGNSEYCLSQRVFAIRSNPEIIDHSYLYFELSKGNGLSQILGKVSGSTVFGIRQDELRTVHVLVPNMDLQKKFSQKVISIYDSIRNNEKQIQELTKMRDWLLPMLMNGQVRIVDQDKEDLLIMNIAAETNSEYARLESLAIPSNKRGFARQVLAGKVVSIFKNDPNFTSIKFQKIQFLAEHIIEADLNQNYYYQAAGPYDNAFMKSIYGHFKAQNWFDSQNQRFVSLNKEEKIEEYYQGYFGSMQESLDKLFGLFYQTTEAEAEIIATIYAVWNNRIIQGKSILDSELIEDFYQWSDRKKQYTNEQIMVGLKWLRDNNLEPKGFGKLIKKAKSKK